MKKSILKGILPLTILSFWIFTKWWYALVIDGTDEILFGFPLPYSCDGFHTSGSRQFFLLEFLVDFAVYFTFWATLFYALHFMKFQMNQRVRAYAQRSLLIATMLPFCLGVLAVFWPENLFYLKRPFDIDLMDTGCIFIWTQQPRPDYYQYHPIARPAK